MPGNVSEQSIKKHSLEKSFQSKVINRLKKIDGLFFFKVKAASIIGVPDIIGCYKGRFFAWELKRMGGKPSQMQILILSKIRKAGGVARLVYPDNVEDCFLELTWEGFAA